MKKEEIIFSDIDLSLEKHAGTNDIFKIKNINSILNSVYNILNYRMFDKKFNPLFYSNVNELLFELNTVGILLDLKSAIEVTIKNFEPRIQLLNVDIQSDIDNHSVTVTIEFKVIGFDNIFNETIFLERTR